jgi:hypothetical protein
MFFANYDTNPPTKCSGRHRRGSTLESVGGGGSPNTTQHKKTKKSSKKSKKKEKKEKTTPCPTCHKTRKREKGHLGDCSQVKQSSSCEDCGLNGAGNFVFCEFCPKTYCFACVGVQYKEVDQLQKNWKCPVCSLGSKTKYKGVVKLPDGEYAVVRGREVVDTFNSPMPAAYRHDQLLQEEGTTKRNLFNFPDDCD